MEQSVTKPNPFPLLVSTRELAELLPIFSDGALRTYRSDGKGPPYIKVAGKVFYDLAEVQAWIEAGKVKPSS